MSDFVPSALNSGSTTLTMFTTTIPAAISFSPTVIPASMRATAITATLTFFLPGVCITATMQSPASTILLACCGGIDDSEFCNTLFPLDTKDLGARGEHSSGSYVSRKISAWRSLSNNISCLRYMLSVFIPGIRWVACHSSAAPLSSTTCCC